MNIAQILVSLVLLLFLLGTMVLIILCIQTMLVKVPFVPTKYKIMLKMIEVADLNSEDVIYDLGSGDGRLVIEAGKCGVKQAIGYETSILLNIYATVRSKLLKLTNTQFLTKSLLESDLTKCSKIFVYLLENKLQELENKILKEGTKDLLIISNTFKFENLKLVLALEKEKIYVYKVDHL